MDRCPEEIPSFSRPYPDGQGIGCCQQEPWKLPLPDFIEELYLKHFKKNQPDNVRSIEQMVKDYNKKKEERRVRRLKEKESRQSGEDVIQS